VKNGGKLSVQAVVKAAEHVWRKSRRASNARGQERRRDGLGLASFDSARFLDDLLAFPCDAGPEARANESRHRERSGHGGMWQAEWNAEGLEEGYYRVAVTVTDRNGHTYTDRSLVFSDPIAGNDTVAVRHIPMAGCGRWTL